MVEEFDLHEITIDRLREDYTSGKRTIVSVVRRYLNRIEAMNDRGPCLKAVIETNPDALDIAETLDAERREAKSRGALHGIPILIKDNIDTADRMSTTAGSLALAGVRPSRDAFVIERLREAGAILLGKANMSEWANFRSSRSTSGWSARGGQCRSPYALDRSPSGSSSGTAAAVSANLAVAGVGTETDGSITAPSSACGLVGIKPTVGLVSRSGIIPISRTQDTAGPMARTVRDAAILLAAMTAIDPGDEAMKTRWGSEMESMVPPGEDAGCPEGESLRGIRIGVARGHFGGDERVTRIAMEGVDRLRHLGVEIIDPVDLSLSDTGEFEVMLYEFKDGINRVLAACGPDVPVRSLKDLIKFNDRHRSEEMPYFGQEILLEAEAKGSLTESGYLTAMEKHRKASDAIASVFTEQRIDAVVLPTMNPPCLIDPVLGDHGGSGPGATTIGAVGGCPHVTVPAGSVFGLPVGLSFIGPSFSEPVLLQIAAEFERATRRRFPPRFLPTVDLTV